MEITNLPTLRPLRLGELLDQAIRLYRRNFLNFLGIIAIVYIPFALLTLVWNVVSTSSLQSIIAENPSSLFTSPVYWFSISGIYILVFLEWVFVDGLGAGVLAGVIARNYLGQKTGILDAYRQAGFLSVKLILALLLVGVLYLAVVVWALVPCIGTLSGPGLALFLGGVVGQLIPPVLMVEKQPVLEAIVRAWDLARRRFWWLIGFAIVFLLFNSLVVTGPILLISYIGRIFLPAATAATWSTVISSLAGSVLRLLILPIQIGAWTLVYFDLRVRTEGFDLSLAALQATDHTTADVSSIPPAAASQNLLTGDDIGRLIILSLIVVALGVIVFCGFYALLLGSVFLFSPR